MYNNLESFLTNLIGRNTVIHPAEEMGGLPLFLSSIYTFHEATLLDIDCLILWVTGELPRVDQIEKHMALVRSQTTRQIIISHKRISGQRIKAYVSRRIPFIADEQQIFLPFLGLKLSHQQHEMPLRSTSFSPIDQCVYLTLLYEEDLLINTTQMAQKLNISEMSASRALNALSEHTLLSFEWGGPLNRSKFYRVVDREQYSTVGLSLLRSPVLKTVYTQSPIEGAPIAGLEALAKLSMPNPPLYSIRAIASKGVHALNLSLTQDPGAFPPEEITELQLWRYNPLLFSSDNLVDPVSLYASLQEDADDRITSALQSVLRGV